VLRGRELSWKVFFVKDHMFGNTVQITFLKNLIFFLNLI
jgi:hypothetical protein